MENLELIKKHNLSANDFLVYVFVKNSGFYTYLHACYSLNLSENTIRKSIKKLNELNLI